MKNKFGFRFGFHTHLWRVLDMKHKHKTQTQIILGVNQC